MLVAKMENGELISLLEQCSYEQLQTLKQKTTFYCPSCQHKVILRLGTKRIWHFSHEGNASCNVKNEPESEYHLSGKTDLYYWLKRQYGGVRLEPFIKEACQRPDLMFWKNGKVYAIEYQCSAISYEDMRKRTESFMTHHIVPLWILGGNRCRRLGSFTYKLSAFDWSCVRKVDNNGLLLFYDPKTKQFLRLHSLSPLSQTTIIAKASYSKLRQSSLPQLFKPCHYDINPQAWLSSKQRWRLQMPYMLRYAPSYFRKLLLKANIPPALFPAEIGIPLQSNYYVNTSPFLWQAWLFIQWIYFVPQGSIIRLQDIVYELRRLLNARIIQYRNFPLFQASFSAPIMEYLQWLTKRQIISEIDKGIYRKEKQTAYPKTMEQALAEDRCNFV